MGPITIRWIIETHASIDRQPRYQELLWPTLVRLRFVGVRAASVRSENHRRRSSVFASFEISVSRLFSWLENLLQENVNFLSMKHPLLFIILQHASETAVFGGNDF